MKNNHTSKYTVFFKSSCLTNEKKQNNRNARTKKIIVNKNLIEKNYPKISSILFYYHIDIERSCIKH